jgi:putative SOS response-associated peptidase YedK
MCGRFTLTWNEWRQVAGALGIEDEGDAAASYRPRFNIAPTDQHFIITSEFERRKAQRARWGLVNRWVRDNSRAGQCINARAETLETAANLPRSISAAPLRRSRRWLLRMDRSQGQAAGALDSPASRRPPAFRGSV